MTSLSLPTTSCGLKKLTLHLLFLKVKRQKKETKEPLVMNHQPQRQLKRYLLCQSQTLRLPNSLNPKPSQAASSNNNTTQKIYNPTINNYN
jgi:hypothetical protein